MIASAPAGEIFPATAMPDANWWNALWPDPAAVLARLGIEASLDSVDLCCGDGLFTVPLAASSRRVVAVDLDEGLLREAERRVADNGHQNCTFVVADARQLSSILTRPVDLVFLANTFHGVPDQFGLARAVRECLKPSGRFIIVNWHQKPRDETPVLGLPRGPRTELRTSPDDAAAVVIPAGFALDRVVDCPPYHYGAVFRCS